MAVGCPLYLVMQSRSIEKKLIAGLQRAVSFNEYKNRADCEICLHKGSVVAVDFNVS